jgi:hypothetical protein
MTAPLAVAALERAMRLDAACVLAAPVSWQQFADTAQAMDARGLFDTLLGRSEGGHDAPAAATPHLREAVLSAAPADRCPLLRAALRQELTAVLRRDMTQVHPDQPLNTLGLDSLLAVEFVRRVSSAIGLKLAATIVFNHTTLATLERELLRRLAPAAVEAPAMGGVSAAVAPAAEAVDTMSEADAILALINRAGTVR